MTCNFFISVTKNGCDKKDTIHDPISKLKVKVFDPIKSKLIPRKGEIRFFVTAGAETLAFETEGYKRHRELLILEMISRYCVYLGLFKAQIHPAWPA
jgi:hypothetical protein